MTAAHIRGWLLASLILTTVAVAKPEDVRSLPIAMHGVVTAADQNGPLNLKLEEKIALMFMAAIAHLEFWCVQQGQSACTLDQLVTGNAVAGTNIGRLKFDPVTDRNYTYSVTVSDTAWDAKAISQSRKLRDFRFHSSGSFTVYAFYGSGATGGRIEKEILAREVSGDSFALEP